jgi:hypothetical protein
MFSKMKSLAPCPTPNVVNRGLPPVDLCSLGEYTRSLRSHHHSSPRDLGTQASPPRKGSIGSEEFTILY